MECIEERALKSNFLLKANSQVFYNDDVWCLTGINTAAAAAEDFPVDDLLNLDLPEMEFQDPCFYQEGNDSQKGGSSFPSSSSSSFSGADEFDLAVPVEDLENLEWLSQIVDDSSEELSLLFPAGNFTAKAPVNSMNRVKPVTKTGTPVFQFTFPRKARSKRSRPNGRLWGQSSPPLTAAAESASTTSSSNGSSTLSPFIFMNPVGDLFSSVEKPPVKRQKRKPDAETGRRCTHCHVQKTPQWRTGPLGPKTLCNACGVRFKSGRLFPEYRPACSPTYSQEIHSNSHRKVLEMRRRKEVAVTDEPGLVPAVQSQSI